MGSTHRNEHLRQGVQVRDRYVVEGLLGVGAFGVVYEVEDRDATMTFALKRVDPGQENHRQAREMLEREGNLLRKLDHPNIVKFYDAWGEDDGSCCVVMERLSGETLARVMEREGALESTFLLTVAEQLADALAHLHARGVVHRDIKPDNIFIEQRLGRDWPMIMDFGLAFAPNSSQHGRPDTEAARVSGTPLYMAPEQILNDTLGPATDVYALGGVLYEMIAGFAPFEDSSSSVDEVMEKKLTHLPSAFHTNWELSGLDTLLAAMLAYEPSKRPTADAVARELREHPLHPARHQPYGWHTTRSSS